MQSGPRLEMLSPAFWRKLGALVRDGDFAVLDNGASLPGFQTKLTINRVVI